MSDAEAAPTSGPQPQQVASFQVVVTGPVQGKLLPVQSFLSCAGDVVARLGRLRLEAVRVLLPERDAPGGGRPPSPSSMRVAWPFLDPPALFAHWDPRPRSPLRPTPDRRPGPPLRP